jgi:NAD(P)-dependent dehydrogenase (short-subunit alcohol dehydrogenase family)
MKIKNSVALITGANRGIGLAFARELLARGAKKVYSTARDPLNITLHGVIPLKLDVTNIDDINEIANIASDVDLLINNAGIAQPGDLLHASSGDITRTIFETNFFGMLNMSTAFASNLKANGGGAIINVLSVASWISEPKLAAYCASKSAAWSITNALRHELAPNGTQVLGLHMGYVDTDLTKGFDIPKSSPEYIVKQALNGLESDLHEVLADSITLQVKQGLTAEKSLYLYN